MTIINGQLLLEQAPIANMRSDKARAHGVSFGLSEAGYDIRIKQDIVFDISAGFDTSSRVIRIDETVLKGGRFCIASAIEEFQMPSDLVGVVHDKSTWARRGLSVFNTVIEPGWNGFLTLELVYHGEGVLHVPAGAGIAQVLFSRISMPAAYNGKYQNQADQPIEAIHEE